MLSLFLGFLLLPFFFFWFFRFCSPAEAAVGGVALGALAAPCGARYIQPAQAIGAGLVLLLVLVLKVLLLGHCARRRPPGEPGGAGRPGGGGAGALGRLELGRPPSALAPARGACGHGGRGHAIAAVLLEVSVQMVGAHGTPCSSCHTGKAGRPCTPHVVLQVELCAAAQALLAQVPLLACGFLMCTLSLSCLWTGQGQRAPEGSPLPRMAALPSPPHWPWSWKLDLHEKMGCTLD